MYRHQSQQRNLLYCKDVKSDFGPKRLGLYFSIVRGRGVLPSRRFWARGGGTNQRQNKKCSTGAFWSAAPTGSKGMAQTPPSLEESTLGPLGVQALSLPGPGASGLAMVLAFLKGNIQTYSQII